MNQRDIIKAPALTRSFRDVFFPKSVLIIERPASTFFFFFYKTLFRTNFLQTRCCEYQAELIDQSFFIPAFFKQLS